MKSFRLTNMWLVVLVTLSLLAFSSCGQRGSEQAQTQGTAQKSTESTPAQTLKINRNGNLRSGPSTSHSILRKVYAGVQVRELEQSNDWYKVELPDRTVGWINAILLVPRPSEQTEAKEYRTVTLQQLTSSKTEFRNQYVALEDRIQLFFGPLHMKAFFSACDPPYTKPLAIAGIGEGSEQIFLGVPERFQPETFRVGDRVRVRGKVYICDCMFEATGSAYKTVAKSGDQTVFILTHAITRTTK